MDQHRIEFEFIIMDDGSTDDSYQIALELEKQEKNICAYQLSKNYTSGYSMFAGLSVCKGGCAMAIPDDEQQPYDTIPAMYKLWQQGEKIIIPHRASRKDGLTTNLTSNLFYKTINRFSDIEYPEGGADLFMIDREVIDIMNTKVHPINTYVVPELLRLGFSPHFFPYDRPVSTNRGSRWTFKKRVKLAKDILFSSSSFPIKFISMIGLSISAFSFATIVFYMYINIFGDKEYWGLFIPGWTSIIVFLAFFSGMILLALGIIAEYIWRIHEEVKGRPGFIIKQKDN